MAAGGGGRAGGGVVTRKFRRVKGKKEGHRGWGEAQGVLSNP